MVKGEALYEKRSLRDCASLSEPQLSFHLRCRGRPQRRATVPSCHACCRSSTPNLNPIPPRAMLHETPDVDGVEVKQTLQVDCPIKVSRLSPIAHVVALTSPALALAPPDFKTGLPKSAINQKHLIRKQTVLADASYLPYTLPYL